ncbi:hypothetical protein F52700_11419 [Fusarium sp. NRRL 52700]|nr:hypothetical protein F52700_11419 [Fusarium sp. NRRL 52700]
MQDFSYAPSEIEEALFDISQSLSSARDALVVTHDTFAETWVTLSVTIKSVEDAKEVISKAQDAVPQIQGILFAALDELSGPLRVLSGVQKGFSCEDEQQRHSEERIRGVGFYVHSSLRTDQWRVWSYPGDSEDIFATLGLTTPSGLLAIYNAYNHNNRLDVPALLQYLESYKSSKCDMVLLGDFNYHPGSWSIKVNGIVTQKITPESKEFAAGVKGLGLLHNRSDVCEPKPRSIDRSLEPLLPPLDAPLGTDNQRDKYLTDIMYGLWEAIHAIVPLSIRDCQPRRLTYLAKRMQKHTAKLDAIKAGPRNARSLASIRRIQRQMSKHSQELWEMFTEDKSVTTKGAYELADIAKKIREPNQVSRTPTLRLGDEVAETDSEKIEMVKKEKFPDNDKPYSKSTPTEPRPRPTDGRPELFMSQDLDDEQLRLIISNLQRSARLPGPTSSPTKQFSLVVMFCDLDCPDYSALAYSTLTTPRL